MTRRGFLGALALLATRCRVLPPGMQGVSFALDSPAQGLDKGLLQ